MQTISVATTKVKLDLWLDEEGRIGIQRLAPVDSQALDSSLPEYMLTLNSPWFKGTYHQPLIELSLSGDDITDHHSKKHYGYQATKELRYVSHEIKDNQYGLPTLLVHLASARIKATCTLSFVTPETLQSYVTLTNCGSEAVTVEYVSSFMLWNVDNCAISNYRDVLTLNVAHNVWAGECQWHELTMAQAGLYPTYEYPIVRSPAAFDDYFKQMSYNHYSFGRVLLSSTGGMSSSNYAPMAILENKESKQALYCQIEHNGSWSLEMGDWFNHVYLGLSGPNFTEHQFAEHLEPGDSFTSVTASVGVVPGGKGEALQALTRYRRTISRTCSDKDKLHVIFNDYMNCLMGEPTEEKLYPLIDKAAEAGCEIFCIDAGWYADGFWWDGVGQWLPSQERFPHGIKAMLDYIRSKGMSPGLWLEIEVMGIKCPLAQEWEDDCFMMLHGKRIISQSRYLLDFTNAKVRAHATAVVKRLVEEYGVGYIKMDYNTNTGPGSDQQGGKAIAPGSALLKHNRAYLAWLKEIFATYPNLIIENCGSGGMRLDYAMLQQHSVQSMTDQTDYTVMGAIAAAAGSMVSPDQAAIWAYPLRSGDEEEVIYNMVNALLLRIHQSGHLAKLSEERFALVKEGLDTYKAIRQELKTALPLWPLGLPNIGDAAMAFGMQTVPVATAADATAATTATAATATDSAIGAAATTTTSGSAKPKLYLAVWRQQAAEPTITIPLPQAYHQVRCLYPQSALERGTRYMLSDEGKSLTISLAQNFTARIFVLE